MSKKNSCKIISLNVRGIRNSIKRSSILHILEIKKHYFISFKKHIPNPVMSYFGKMNGEAKSIFCTALVTVKVFAYFTFRSIY